MITTEDLESRLAALENITSVLGSKLTITFLVATTLLPLLLRLYIDYLNYIALGPGGTPSTPVGFVKVKILGLFAVRNPYKPRSIPLNQIPSPGCLTRSLPSRSGPRP